MKKYLRVMLGAKSVHADECFKGNFIGAGFDIDQDLTKHLPDNWREFNIQFIPICGDSAQIDHLIPLQTDHLKLLA